MTLRYTLCCIADRVALARLQRCERLNCCSASDLERPPTRTRAPEPVAHEAASLLLSEGLTEEEDMLDTWRSWNGRGGVRSCGGWKDEGVRSKAVNRAPRDAVRRLNGVVPDRCALQGESGAKFVSQAHDCRLLPHSLQCCSRARLRTAKEPARWGLAAGLAVLPVANAAAVRVEKEGESPRAEGAMAGRGGARDNARVDERAATAAVTTPAETGGETEGEMAEEAEGVPEADVAAALELTAAALELTAAAAWLWLRKRTNNGQGSAAGRSPGQKGGRSIWSDGPPARGQR
eukprot:6209489-Pleurochrysis_carterae.AAC.3